MTDEVIQKFKELPRLKLLIIIFTIWQYFSILGIAVLNWPNSLVWLNLGLLLGFIALCPIYESLLMLILSIPFYVVLPNTRFDSLSMWRILFVVLLAVWFIRDRKFRFDGIIFLPWDKYLGYFMFLGLVVTLFFGQFRAQGLKEILFLLNIYIFYVVLINVLKNKQQIFELIRYVIWALAIIVTLGFTQLIGTFLTNLDTFWVYWADNVSKLYYGGGFASVALYSNSWFSYTGGRELRMFSIMSDSQSFAYICIFGLCIGTALTRSVFKHIRKWLWSGIRFAALGMILSGTRAVWVGMLAPFFAVALGYFKDIQKHLAKKYLWPFIIIFALFLASPFINIGLNYLRVNQFHENFLSRAESIYDVNDVSNSGRIAIWKSSLKFALYHPLGVGFSNFIVSLDPQATSKDYETLSNEVNARYNLPQKYISAHNLYLQILVETGVLGLGIFLMFLFSVARYLWNFIKHHEKREDFLVYFVAQALLMLVWIMAAAVFDVTLLNDKVLMFFFIDLGLAGLVVKRYQEYEIEE
ncbi:MAG: O-antigen ligase family protein [Candidatus Paceibacterales bacterium]